jgi:hypothetical protein
MADYNEICLILNDLTPNELDAIKRSIKEIEAGLTIPQEEILKRYGIENG